MNEKSFNSSRPSNVPLKRDNITFLVYNANTIANKEGIKDKAESSIKLFLEL